MRALLRRFEEISARFAEPLDDDEMQKLLDEQARLQDQIDASDAWELDRTLEIAMDALRCPPPTPTVTTLSGGEKRRVALCQLLLAKPDMLLLDEPTNHLDAESVAWLERFLQEYPGTVVAVTHDRYFLDNVAGWILELDRGRGIPWQGNYTSWLEQKEKRLEVEEKQASRAPAHARSASSSGCACRRARARRRARRASRPTRSCAPRRSSACPETVEITIPPGPRLGDVVVEAKGLAQGLRRPAADRRPLVRAAARRHRRRDRPERRRQDHAVPHAHRPGEARRRRAALGETVKLAYVDQDRAGSTRRRRVYEEISGGQRPHPGRAPRAERARLRRRASASRAPSSRSPSARSRAASATACTSRSC